MPQPPPLQSSPPAHRLGLLGAGLKPGPGPRPRVALQPRAWRWSLAACLCPGPAVGHSALPCFGQPRLGLLGQSLKPGPGVFRCRDLRLSPARSSAWSRSASRRACATCSSAAWRTRSSSVRADSATRDCAPLTALSRSWSRRGHLLLRGPRLLLGGGPRRPRLGEPCLSFRRCSPRLPRIGLGLLGAGLKPGPGVFRRRDLRFEPGAQLGLVPLGVPAGLRHLLLRSVAHPVQLRPSRLGRLPRLRRVVPSLVSLGLGLGEPCLSLRRASRLPRLSLGLSAAPPEREPRPTRIPRVGRPAALPGQHLAPPEPGQRRMRLPGHQVRRPAVPLLCRPRHPQPRLILTTRKGASEDLLTGLDHRQAPFHSPGQRNRAGPGGRKPGREPQPALLRRADHSRADEFRAAASTTSLRRLAGGPRLRERPPLGASPPLA